LDPAGKEKIRTTNVGPLWIKVPFHLTLFCFLLTAASCAIPRIIVLHDPLSPEEHINLGLTYEKRGETEEAIEEYKKAAKDLPTAYLYLGNIYYEKGEYSVAERYYRKVIENNPDLADAYNNLAWMFYCSGTNLKEAEELSQKALELDPSNANYKDTFKAIGERIKQEGLKE
jgi:tetratricopeptide (TPR) repeat protein